MKTQRKITAAVATACGIFFGVGMLLPSPHHAAPGPQETFQPQVAQAAPTPEPQPTTVLAPATHGKSKPATYAERLAAKHHLSVVFTDHTPCGPMKEVRNEDGTIAPFGCFSSTTPGKIYLSHSARLSGSEQQRARIFYLVQHESSHAAIYKQCGTTAPEVDKDAEHLADAYAVHYYHAQDGLVYYGYSTKDLEAAKSLRVWGCLPH